jgi:hypothetical protein
LLRAEKMGEDEPIAGPSRPRRHTTHTTTTEVDANQEDDVIGVMSAQEPSRLAKDKIHRDEAQVLLDTKRSFVAYPKGDSRCFIARTHVMR